MKKVLLFVLLLGSQVLNAQDTLSVESRSAAADIIYGQLNPALYGYGLLDRSFSPSDYIHQQVKGNYNQVHEAYSWMQMYGDLSLAYTDTNLMKPISTMVKLIDDYFDMADSGSNERIIQPFTLLLHNISIIDSVRYTDGSMNVVDNQFQPTIPEANLYIKKIIKCASLFELEPENGYTDGTILYHPSFISTSPDIEVQSLAINVGRGFEPFGPLNTTINYVRDSDSVVAHVAIEYLLADSLLFDTLSFYLVTDGNIRSRSFEGWDDEFNYDGEKMDFSFGVKFACDNDQGFYGIKRPIFFVPPYRPSAQFYVTLSTYWEQFGFESLFHHLSDMGYDVIFLKEHSGHESIELAGEELARFIMFMNTIKNLNHPTESWENILVGFSAGGQHARYALMYLEKQHMEHGGPHHHTRLYIPFDSPHLGANVPLFAQAVYKDFSNESLLGAMPWLSLNDDASTDMLFWHYKGSTVIESGSDLLTKTIYPGPHDNRVALNDRFANDFHHSFTYGGDLRRSYPSFTRNVAISTGSYNKTYEDEYGLTSGMLLFKQNGMGLPIVPPSISFIFRQLYSSNYSSTEAQLIFKRKDTYLTLGVLPWWVNKEYRTMGAWEWDNAQGGYKTEFYQGIFTGAAYILRQNSLFLSGDRLYKDEVMFLPLVSALGINPNTWWNNNLYYNPKDEGLMRQSFNVADPSSDFFGYPHLEYPTSHFNITPFEAVYADINTYDHIKMQQSVDDYNLGQNYLVQLRNFICDEVESESVFLQNKVIGDNHVQTDPNYEYKAWYKARNEVVIGKQVTPKTDIGDYVIKSTGDITVYAGQAVLLLPGFEAQTGSNFYAYIDISDCDANYEGRSASFHPPYNSIQSTVDYPDRPKDRTNVPESKVSVYPNPTNGQFTVEIKNFDTENKGNIALFNAIGKRVKQVSVTGEKTTIDLSTYENGIYLVSYNNGETTQVVRVSKTN